MNSKTVVPEYHAVTRFTWGGVLLALGIVFGDLGTSPLYTFKAIIGEKVISETLVLGGVSAIFWTLLFQTTLKYVFITMRADNHGEGGIFSLYTLIRRHAKWVLWPAIIGGSFMIADSLITPPISVMSAMEGLKQLNPGIPILPITISIIVLLFLFQQSGTKRIGVFFGPAMIAWFSMIAILGTVNLAKDLTVLRAINPMYAYHLVVNYPGGLWVLGGVFLCTTGAEALYADMGHVGRKNIQVAWIFIKISLLLCYFGEAVLLLKHNGQTLSSVDAFFGLVPQWFLIPSIVIATFATIIASQALISGTFTLFNEAVRLNIWPKLRIEFPTEMRGQVYVPAVNWMMMIGCVGMVLHFKESSNMEAAFGLSVTLTMLMTTILLSYYLYSKRISIILVFALAILFLWIESTFLVANLSKFSHGGWISLLIGLGLISIMYVWHAGKKLKSRYKKLTNLSSYKSALRELSNDQSVPKYSTHLVYLTGSGKAGKIEERIIDSILFQQPKRADIYWFIHVDVTDEPYTSSYSVEIVEPEEIIFVRFKLGFRIVPRLNLLFKKVVSEMTANNEVNIDSKYCDTGKKYVSGDFRFIVMKSFLSVENDLSFWDNIIMRLHFMLDKISLPDDKTYGLDYSNVIVEHVPLMLGESEDIQLTREK
ncbi:potassium transporter Kup [Flavipsychrobacter stenotrophus]|uniref:Probable potassium transport system protein Kup n=2 Tax=Flavipsychrobacter stenotrophus TaxID=2077091 RepID=A0A2S7T321_9BACT|nr:potassium transporter Kup [Flavipsychrobacter stenotrophus]